MHLQLASHILRYSRKHTRKEDRQQAIRFRSEAFTLIYKIRRSYTAEKVKSKKSKAKGISLATGYYGQGEATNEA